MWVHTTFGFRRGFPHLLLSSRVVSIRVLCLSLWAGRVPRERRVVGNASKKFGRANFQPNRTKLFCCASTPLSRSVGGVVPRRGRIGRGPSELGLYPDAALSAKITLFTVSHRRRASLRRHHDFCLSFAGGIKGEWSLTPIDKADSSSKLTKLVVDE